jgi:hypothetical protein
VVIFCMTIYSLWGLSPLLMNEYHRLCLFGHIIS